MAGMRAFSAAKWYPALMMSMSCGSPIRLSAPINTVLDVVRIRSIQTKQCSESECSSATFSKKSMAGKRASSVAI